MILSLRPSKTAASGLSSKGLNAANFLFLTATCVTKCRMFSKLYLAVLAISVALSAFLVFYAWSWLGSIDSPAAVAAGYSFHASNAMIVLAVSAVLLLLLGNVILWTTRNAWAMWGTLIYFAIFALAKFFWLDMAFAQFEKANALAASGFSAGPVIAVGLIVAAAVIVFLDQFMVVRLLAKMYPEKEDEPRSETAPDEAATAE